MAQLKLSEAARQVGVSRPTIYKYVQDGKLSVTKDRKGQNQVDVSELLRVFGTLKSETEIQDDKLNRMQHRQRQTDTPPSVALQIEVERLRAQLEARAAEVSMLKERVTELKDREQYADQERQKLLALLEQSQRLLAAPPAPAPAPRATTTRKTPAKKARSKAIPSIQAIPSIPTKKAKAQAPKAKKTGKKVKR